MFKVFSKSTVFDQLHNTVTISSCDFVWLLFKGDDNSRVAFIELNMN